MSMSRAGGGSFSPRYFGTGGFEAISLAVGDFNGDSTFDLAVANIGSHNLSILLNDGTGSFGSPSLIVLGTGAAPESVITRDFNGDGKLDLAVAQNGTNNVRVLLGNGNGTFGTLTTFAVGWGPAAVVATDFDGDGKLDLATSNRGSDDVSVLLGNGAGSFGGPVTFSTGTGSAPQRMTVADFNRDGRPDLATASGAAMSVLLNR